MWAVGSVPINTIGPLPPKMCNSPDAFNIHFKALKICPGISFLTIFPMVPMIFCSNYAIGGEDALKSKSEN